MQTHIEADEVRQTQRTHRMVIAEFHRSVDVTRAGHTLFDHAHRFQAQGYAQTTGSKTRNITHHNRFLLHVRGYLTNNRSRFIAGALAYDDLYQLHDVYGIEEVHPDHLFGPARSAGNFGDS